MNEPAPPLSALEELRALRARIPPLIHLGTSSWNYEGWRGLIYHRTYPKSGAVAKMLGEYAEWPLFGTVGIDASLYRPLSVATWRSYAAVLPAGFPCLSKVWNRITAHSFTEVQRDVRPGPNPDFLNPDLFVNEVLGPARDGGGAHVGPFVFELQAIPPSAGLPPDRFAARLDDFLGRLPAEARYAVEVRNPEYLTPAYLAVLREHRVAHVLNSWTRMPSIGQQLNAADVITAPFIVARAPITPGRTYDDAVDTFAPYDRIREPAPALRLDLVRLAERAIQLRLPAFIVVGNRAEGNSPGTVAAVARMLVERMEGPAGTGG